jgi:precorrin-2 dehydrogenase/sirohydrochlorin ferrochelatase
MGVFPLCIDIKNKKCVVIGGGKIAYAKIKVLLQFGAQIIIISPKCIDDILQLVKTNKIIWIKKSYSKNDILDAFMVVCATSNEIINDTVYKDAKNNNIYINVVDDKNKCNFIFPSIVKRKDLIISISTSGKYPALSKAIRRKLEIEFPEEWGDKLNELGEFRKKVIHSFDKLEDKKKILTDAIKDMLK